jgi:hypothetical protein
MSISSNAMPFSAELFKIADELWQELEEASFIDPPLLLKPFYNEIVKKDEVEFKTPSSMSDKEYNSFLGKSNWNGVVKYSLYSINLHCPDKLIRLKPFTDAYSIKTENRWR